MMREQSRSYRIPPKERMGLSPVSRRWWEAHVAKGSGS